MAPEIAVTCKWDSNAPTHPWWDSCLRHGPMVRSHVAHIPHLHFLYTLLHFWSHRLSYDLLHLCIIPNNYSLPWHTFTTLSIQAFIQLRKIVWSLCNSFWMMPAIRNVICQISQWYCSLPLHCVFCPVPMWKVWSLNWHYGVSVFYSTAGAIIISSLLVHSGPTTANLDGSSVFVFMHGPVFSSR